MSNRLCKPQLAMALVVVLALTGMLALAGSLALAAPPAATEASQVRQETPGTSAVTDTTTMPGQHLLHHPEGIGAGMTGTLSVPGMMGMMGEMMTMMGHMHGMMGPDMMGMGMMTGTMPMTDTMPLTGSMAVSDCLMAGPMMSMMGSMMSMMGAMQTMQGMMAGHGMMDMGMMGGMGMMGMHAMTDTMPMHGAMPMTSTMPMTDGMPMTGTTMEPGMMMGSGMMGMGMMGSPEMGFMMDHMMQMMGQMQAMVAACQQMTPAQTTQPYDLGFIDSMIAHHEGALAMAQQALEQAEHEEIRELAQAIIDAQEAEIAQMREWRDAWYPGAAPTMGMGMEMGMMEIPEGDQPFDLRFIDAMISHHEGAIAMAQEALISAEHEEIRDLAQAIIDAQQTEIEQLQEWRAAWHPDAE